MKTIVALLAVVLSLAVGADVPNREDRQRNPRERADAELMALYDSLRELPLEDQRQQMWALSSNTKAALWKLNVERYVHAHPELGVEVHSILLEGIRLISSPAWFDIEQGSFGYVAKTQALAEHKRRVESVLQPEAIYEVFMRLGPEPRQQETPMSEPNDGRPTSKFTPRVDADQCSCASYWECWYWGSGGYDCFPAWCSVVYHCGWYGNEACTGRCKWGG